MYMYREVTTSSHLFNRDEDVDYSGCIGRVNSGQEVSEGHVILCHQVVHDHPPFSQTCHAHLKERWGEEKLEGLFTPRLPAHLEPT